jgi:hypothetical protein
MLVTLIVFAPLSHQSILATCILLSPGFTTIYENLPAGIVPAGDVTTFIAHVEPAQLEDNVVSKSSCIGIVSKSDICYILRIKLYY